METELLPRRPANPPKAPRVEDASCAERRVEVPPHFFRQEAKAALSTFLTPAAATLSVVAALVELVPLLWGGKPHQKNGD